MAEAADRAARGPLRTVFFGTPHFAAVVLEILHKWPGCDIVGVITQPDRKSGRGQKIIPGECASLARQLGLPLFQPASLRGVEACGQLSALRPDILAVAAYGQLIPNDILAIPPLGAINVHASLLPAYRGAAPIARAIMENWQEGAKTGVSIMQVVEELDAGDVYATREIPIGNHTSESLTDLLAREGGELLVETLAAIAKGEARPMPQNPAFATYAKKLAREDGIINWDEPAAKIAARARGLWPWPGAHAEFNFFGRESMPVTICECEVAEERAESAPGSIYADKSGLKIACQDKWLRISRLCAPGKKPCSGRDFVNGHLRGNVPGICGKAN